MVEAAATLGRVAQRASELRRTGGRGGSAVGIEERGHTSLQVLGGVFAVPLVVVAVIIVHEKLRGEGKGEAGGGTGGGRSTGTSGHPQLPLGAARLGLELTTPVGMARALSRGSLGRPAGQGQAPARAEAA